MCHQRRDLERHPAVDAVGLGVDRPEQIGRAPQVCKHQVEEEVLVQFGRRRLAGDVGVVHGAVLDREIEDRGT